MRRNPLAFLEEVAQYGPIAHFRVGRQDVFLLSDPAGIEDVLVTHAGSFHKGRALERAKRTLGEGLLTSEGAIHLRQRRLVQPAFHKARVASYAEAMIRAAHATRERWQAGMPFDLAVEMNRLTLAIVADTLFGAQVGSGSDTARVQQAITDVMEMFDLVLVPFADWLVHLPLPRMRRYRAAQQALDEVIYGIIAARRASGLTTQSTSLESAIHSNGPDSCPSPRINEPMEAHLEQTEGLDRGDLLSMLLTAQDTEGAGGGMTDQQLRDEVITLFLAGHETTANALTWTWVLLARHPEAERHLHAEIDAVLGERSPSATDVGRLPYARAVIAEAMRLYPPAWTMGRRAIVDYHWGGCDMPAGSLILMSQWILHRDARYWPEPDRFDPERWLPEPPPRPRFVYFPFGGGNRVCVGESFAWTEAILVLATIAQRWRLRLDLAHPVEPQPLITLRTRYGVRASAEPRRG
jgi:cytochrome P450